MLKRDKFKPAFKFWIEFEGKPLLGKGGAAILEQIKKDGSISKAAQKLGMSYRYVWKYLNEIRKITGEPAVKTFKGGKNGGGGAQLTELGEYLLKKYSQMSHRLEIFLFGKSNGSK